MAEEKKGTIFSTDQVLALLMASVKTVRPWHIKIVRRADGTAFLDRADSQLVSAVDKAAATGAPVADVVPEILDGWCVNEPVYEMPTAVDLNQALAVEGAHVTSAYRQAIIQEV